MKKILGILLVVCFLMSVTAVAVSAEPSVVKEKKTNVNSETNKNMDMKNMGMKKDMKEHGHEEGHGHEGYGHEGYGHEEHGYRY
jgi:hypothetical protein